MAALGEGIYRITDIGISGSLWYYDGSNWLHESPIILLQRGDGWLLPSLASANAATYSQSGTLITVTSNAHTIPSTKYNGCNVYLAIASGLAAAGWFSNFQYISANQFSCVSATAQTTSGTVNTNLAETIITGLTKTIPGGLLGTNGAIASDIEYSCAATANGKGVLAKLDTAIFKYQIAGASILSAKSSNRITNKNSAAKQSFFSSGWAGGYGNSTSAAEYSAINTAIDQQLRHSLQIVAANDFIALENITVVLYPS